MDESRRGRIVLACTNALLISQMDHWTEAFQNLKQIPQASWRAYCDTVNQDLIARWWTCGKKERVLKTDLFEEAMGTGLCLRLHEYGEHVFGIDFSRKVAAEACARNRNLHGITADARRLPFTTGSFDGIISTSTLDHFTNREELIQSIREIARVLRPGGTLILTLDNPGNPLIWLRQILPFRLLHRYGVVPYYVGYTCNYRSFKKLLLSMGFLIVDATAIAHFPRLPAVVLARWADKRDSPKFRLRLGSVLSAFEAMAKWPSRFATGNYFAVKAVKES